jgi:ATP-binding cassette subfamily C protein EexD
MSDSSINWYEPLKTSCRDSLVAVGSFSFVSNLLMLVPAFFMLNVYDKAIGSNSLSTLAVLSFIAILMFLGLGAMEVVRSRVLIAIGRKIDQIIGPLVYRATFQNALKVGAANATTQPLRDFNSLRQFVSGNGAVTVFDTPWMPIYILVMFMFHPVLGWLGVISALVMVAIAILNQKATAERLQLANAASQKNLNNISRDLANAEVIAAMGMFDSVQGRWNSGQNAARALQEEASQRGGVFSSITKTYRLAVQSAAIGVGAFLVLEQEISPGMLIAGSILVGRALQPVELAVGSWKGFVDAKGQYQRLKMLFEQTGWELDRMPLPDLCGGVSGVKATVTPPGAKMPVLLDATFEIKPGTVCMVVGPSGAGKSTLVRGILGLWPTSSGNIRIDGADASHYNRYEIGPQIGYLPQDIEIFAGTVSGNIARQGEVDPDDVILAAQDAGIHDFILSLPDGYDTELGREAGVILSPGQRQRLALARALYRRPKLVILDEPNSNLDKLGESALNQAIRILKEAGSTIIIVSHREGAMSLADQLIVVSSGEVVDSGTRDEVLQRLRQKATVSQSGKQLPQQPVKSTIKTVPV